MDNMLLETQDHKTQINKYVSWFFKKHEPFVVLKKMVNKATNTTKMYIVLPVREREFVSAKVDLFNPKTLDVPGFNFSSVNIKAYKTLYSGDIFEAFTITPLLATFKMMANGDNTYSKGTRQELFIYRDYTTTIPEQKNRFALVRQFTTAYESIMSVYRLLHNKYVTVISIEFNQLENDNNSL